MRIYLISHYGEDGSEDVRGTVDRDGLPDFIADYVRNVWFSGSTATGLNREERIQAATKEVLANLPFGLAQAEARPGEPWDLIDGWGGVQIHAIDVTPEKP